MLCGTFYWHGLGLPIPLEGRVTANPYKVVLSDDHVYPLMTHFYANGTGLFQDGNALIHREQGVSEKFKEYENGFYKPDLNPTEHQRDALDAYV